MDTTNWPYHGGPARGENTLGIGYLNWYIPRLKEQRKHDLSHSGLQYHWNFAELMEDEIFEIGKHHIMDKIDPRIFVAEKEGVPPEQIVVTHGATQALQVALLSVAHNEGQKVIAVETPAYAPVSQTANLLGYETRPVSRHPPKGDLGHWRINKSEWDKVLSEASVLMLTPILNPVGWDLHPDDKDWIAKKCEELSVFIVADEVYSDSMIGHPDFKKMFTYGDHCISINSLTKVHGLGSIRFGWIVASKEVAKRAQDVFRTVEGMISSPSVRIARRAFNELHLPLEKIESLRKQNLPILRDLLQKHGIDWNEPEYGVFGAFKLPNDADSLKFVDTECARHSLLAVPGSMFSDELTSWLRVAWSIEHEAFIDSCNALDRALSDLKN